MAINNFTANLEGVVHGGEENLIVCMSKTSKEFTSKDIVGKLVDWNGMGGSKAVRETKLYHRAKPFKQNGQESINDISITELLTKAQLQVIYGYYKDNTDIYFGVFDAEHDFEEIYSAIGQVNKWGGELPDAEDSKLTYTLILQDEFINATYTDEVVGE